MIAMAKKPVRRFPKISVFSIVNALLMILVCLACIIPFWIILTSSLSNNGLLQKNGVLDDLTNHGLLSFAFGSLLGSGKEKNEGAALPPDDASAACFR